MQAIRMLFSNECHHIANITVPQYYYMTTVPYDDIAALVLFCIAMSPIPLGLL